MLINAVMWTLMAYKAPDQKVAKSQEQLKRSFGEWIYTLFVLVWIKERAIVLPIFSSLKYVYISLCSHHFLHLIERGNKNEPKPKRQGRWGHVMLLDACCESVDD